MAARFAGVDEVLATADEVGDRLLGDRRRLAVVVSDLGTSRWAVIEPGVEIDWHDVADPLAAALAWLEKLAGLTYWSRCRGHVRGDRRDRSPD